MSNLLIRKLRGYTEFADNDLSTGFLGADPDDFRKIFEVTGNHALPLQTRSPPTGRPALLQSNPNESPKEFSLRPMSLAPTREESPAQLPT